MEISIFVAYHKYFKFLNHYPYIPIQIGSINSKENLGILRDDKNENISHLNNKFCELTATFWAWKNCNSDIIGINHYRRVFSSINSNWWKDKLYETKVFTYNFFGKVMMHNPNNLNIPFNKLDKFLLNDLKSIEIVNNNQIVVPAKYYLGTTTLFQHFDNILTNDYLISLLEIVKNCENKEFSIVFESSLSEKNLYPCNMFISNREVFNEYCALIFPILFQHEILFKEKQNNYDRIAGYMGELLTNAFLNYKSKHGFKLKEKKILIID